MERRRFDHLVVELSVAVGRVVPRYALWLRLGELDWNPDSLTRDQVLGFIDEHVAAFLDEHALTLPPREAKRLRKLLVRYDPRYPTPYETMQRLGATRT